MPLGICELLCPGLAKKPLQCGWGAGGHKGQPLSRPILCVPTAHRTSSHLTAGGERLQAALRPTPMVQWGETGSCPAWEGRDLHPAQSLASDPNARSSERRPRRSGVGAAPGAGG